MLVEALTANLPLIAVHTSDTVNVSSVLSWYLAGTCHEWTGEGPIRKTMFCIGTPRKSYRELYSNNASTGATLVVVNPDVQDPLLFEGGTLIVPKDMRRDLVKSLYSGHDLDLLVQALQGLTYKEMIEVCHMAITVEGHLSPNTVHSTRKKIIKPIVGVRPVPTDQFWYVANKELEDWLAVDGKLFLNCQHEELSPKGLLFSGNPGTGKTMGAKYLARKLQVPLYQLDLGMLMSKFVGESEKNLGHALQMIEQMSPCIMLIDEVEKIFAHQEDSGTTSRLLSSLLWWLQERTSRTLTILTTNDETSLPAELYRVGRIDSQIVFPLLSPKDAKAFRDKLVNKCIEEYGAYGISTVPYSPGNNKVSHAEVTGQVLRYFKKAIASQI